VTLKFRLILSISVAATSIVVGFALITLNLRHHEEQIRFDEKSQMITKMSANLVSQPLWNFDLETLAAIGESILADNDIVRLVVYDELSIPVYDMAKPNNYLSEQSISQVTIGNLAIGSVELYFTREHILQRLQLHILQLATMLIVLLFSITAIVVFAALSLTKPLYQMVKALHTIGEGDFNTRIPIHPVGEFKILSDAINKLRDEVQNREERVKKISAEAAESEVKFMLEQQKFKIEQNQRLESDRLRQELQSSLDELQATQQQLINAEKMAMLGSLVAGVAHEINTPLGIGVTASSFLAEQLRDLGFVFESKELSESDLRNWIEEAKESTELLQKNLRRAAEIIRSFKQVSVDQTSEAIRDYELGAYLQEIISSLQPHIKRTKHHIEVDCPRGVFITSDPGAMAQIITNLVMNSVIHAFSPNTKGTMSIILKIVGNQVCLEYSDNGKGIPVDELPHIFEPFRTSMRNAGGSGLGTYIIYNLVTQKLGGNIEVKSNIGQGLQYFICFSPERIIHKTPALAE
jgi:signal transduction histidine kinase